MSMYDNLRCEYPLPGLPDATGIEFQTKDTESQFLDDYKITADGQLMIEEYDIEDRSDPNAEGLMRLVGSAARIPKGWKSVDFTGNLNFYGDKNNGSLFLINFSEGTKKMVGDDGKEVDVPEAEWFEYDAIFEKGKLISVERV